MMKCGGTVKKNCGEEPIFRVSVLDPGRETSGNYCRSHASCAVLRAAFLGQRVLAMKQAPPATTFLGLEIPTHRTMVTGESNDEFAESDSLGRR